MTAVAQPAKLRRLENRIVRLELAAHSQVRGARNHIARAIGEHLLREPLEARANGRQACRELHDALRMSQGLQYLYDVRAEARQLGGVTAHGKGALE